MHFQSTNGYSIHNEMDASDATELILGTATAYRTINISKEQFVNSQEFRSNVNSS